MHARSGHRRVPSSTRSCRSTCMWSDSRSHARFVTLLNIVFCVLFAVPPLSSACHAVELGCGTHSLRMSATVHAKTKYLCKILVSQLLSNTLRIIIAKHYVKQPSCAFSTRSISRLGTKYPRQGKRSTIMLPRRASSEYTRMMHTTLFAPRCFATLLAFRSLPHALCSMLRC